MGLRLMCVVGVALMALLLLLLTAAILRLAVMLVQLVTLRYTLAIGVVVLSSWFVESRRQRYAKGFYSCSRVPQTQQQTQEQTKLEEEELEEQEQEEQAAEVAPVPVQLKKVATAPPSETESEDDDCEVGGMSSASKTPVSSPSQHSKSLLDVRTRSSTTDGELQRRQATRPRSSSAAGDSRSSGTIVKGPISRGSHTDAMERKRRVPRRRAETGMTSNTEHNERSRRATYTSKQDAFAASSRSSSERVEDALRSDGYWIGDFRVQRRLVSRRNSPKAN